MISFWVQDPAIAVGSTRSNDGKLIPSRPVPVRSPATGPVYGNRDRFSSHVKCIRGQWKELEAGNTMYAWSHVLHVPLFS